MDHRVGVPAPTNFSLSVQPCWLTREAIRGERAHKSSALLTFDKCKVIPRQLGDTDTELVRAILALSQSSMVIFTSLNHRLNAHNRLETSKSTKITQTVQY